jgi:glyoxylase-like metal-dependent hydrolase (beta-lactamase superfamily II)
MAELKNIYRFKLGNFECQVINDGTLLGQGRDRQPVPVMDTLCLLVKTGDHTALIDTGFGEQPVVGGIRQTKVGNLLKVLETEGEKISDIDTVILSHAHPDHVGGIADDQGRPQFPNARIIMFRQEWDFWMNGPDLSRVNEHLKQATLTVIKKKLLPLKERFNLIEGEVEVLSGIRIIKSAGHTPGHINLLISSGSQQMICIFDLVHSQLEFSQPDLFKDSDMLPEQSSQSKEKTFVAAASSNTLVFASHYFFPGLGYIRRNDNRYSWKEY